MHEWLTVSCRMYPFILSAISCKLANGRLGPRVQPLENLGRHVFAEEIQKLPVLANEIMNDGVVHQVILVSTWYQDLQHHVMRRCTMHTSACSARCPTMSCQAFQQRLRQHHQSSSPRCSTPGKHLTGASLTCSTNRKVLRAWRLTCDSAAQRGTNKHTHTSKDSQEFDMQGPS